MKTEDDLYERGFDDGVSSVEHLRVAADRAVKEARAEARELDQRVHELGNQVMKEQAATMRAENEVRRLKAEATPGYASRLAGALRVELYRGLGMERGQELVEKIIARAHSAHASTKRTDWAPEEG